MIKCISGTQVIGLFGIGGGDNFKQTIVKKGDTISQKIPYNNCKKRRGIPRRNPFLVPPMNKKKRGKTKGWGR